MWTKARAGAQSDVYAAGYSIPPLPPGVSDEPFKGRMGGGLTGGGPNWRFKLPKELAVKIKSQRDLPKMVIRKAHNVIQEVPGPNPHSMQN